MTAVCLDSSVVLVWILQERGWQAVDRLLTRSDVEPVVPGPALTEVVLTARRKGNRSTGEKIRDTLEAFGVRFDAPTTADLLRAAQLLEASASSPGPAGESLSLADGLIISVAERLGCPLISRDTYWSLLAHEGHTSARVTHF